LFDLATAARALGNGNPPLDSIGIAYGVPTCLLSLSKEVLAALPTPILRGITRALLEGNEGASEAIANLKRKIFLENGIIEIDTETGTFKFVSAASRNKLDQNAENDDSNLGGFLNALVGAAQVGAEIYTNYVNVTTLLTGIKDCLESYKTFNNLQKGRSSLIADPADLEARYAIEIAQARDAEDFLNQSNRVLSDISTIVIDRVRDPSKEPKFNSDFLTSGTEFEVDSPEESTPSPVFRLVFGPPKSKKGQFLFSVDGLYYDSQGKDVPVVSGLIPNQELYKFNYPANLGGKGEALSTKQLTQFVDTIFDPANIDDSVEMTNQYQSDHFLQVLISQKALHVYSLSSQINSLLTAGYTFDSAMVTNSYQQLLATEAQHNTKINKRKKQIEIAIKAPLLFGSNRLFNYGEVPINDFSFLSKLNLSVELEKQKRLTFRQGEVSGVVLPISATYVKAKESESTPFFEHLVVTPIGVGSLMQNSGSGSYNILSLTDSIVQDGLIAVYNCLEAEVTTPGSNEFNLLNCASKTNRGNAAQLVGDSPSSLFVSGLGIPYLTGMVKRDATTGAVSGNGSYIQLPQIAQFQDLMYNSNGCTISMWVHVPDLLSSSLDYCVERGWSVSSFHKVLFACENSGGANKNEVASNLQINYGTDTVRGLVCGFTRDRQIVSDQEPSDVSSLNPLDGSICFYIAPTRSFNSSDIGFIRDTVTVDCGSTINKTLKLAIPVSSVINSLTLSSVNDEFCDITLTISPKDNQIKLYFDGTLMATSSLPEVFGSVAFKPIRVPSFILTSSLSYKSTVHGDFTNGPTVSSLTPWIIGSGFSDGLTEGFMGNNSGLESGLNGFVGSLKFYNRPLNNSEVLSNFNNQSGFFKNIDI
jgi:hypothetical protein